MRLSSTAFDEGGAIPRRFTADGANVSPPLAWAQPPEGTRSFALICDDPDAPRGTWVHWVVYDLPADRDTLPEATPHAGAIREQFLAENGDVARCFDSQPDFAPIDIDDGDADVVVDVDLLAEFPAQYQHVATLLRALSDTAAAILRHDPPRQRPAGKFSA